MKIGVFALPGWEKLLFGGYKTATKNFLKMFKELGYEVYINPISPDLDVYYFVAPLPVYIPLATMLKGKGKKIIVHVHTVTDDIYGGFIGDDISAKLYAVTAPKMLEIADVIFTPTEFGKKRIVEIFKVPEEKIYAISNGVDVRRFGGLKQKVECLKVFGNISTVLYRKGVVDFVKIGKELPEKVFLWYGKKLPYSILSEGEKIREAVENSPENVIFYGYAEDVLRAYKAMDALLSTSLVELEGIPIVEAAAAGLPLFLRDIPPYREKFTEEEAFFWKDPEDAIKIIKEVTVKDAAKKAKRARKKVEKEYSLNVIKKKLKRIMESLI